MNFVFGEYPETCKEIDLRIEKSVSALLVDEGEKMSSVTMIR